MNWTQLLNADRLGAPGRPEQETVRSAFQRDFDRIIFSTPWRRMHGKTQVFPLPQSDVIHTRLTHSLEVSCVARSLAAVVCEKLDSTLLHRDSVTAIASASALAHDLGNPPFGHSGEDAIRTFFAGEGSRYLSSVTLAQCADLTMFEGNALGFRLITRTKPKQSKWPGGLQLTHATLGAFVKYPKASIPVGRIGYASEKKFGFFQSEASIFEGLAAKLGLKQKSDSSWCRHPLALLVEAADDICYRIMDVEDGYRLGLVPFDATVRLLRGVADLEPYPTNELTLGGIITRDDQVAYLRAKAINNLVYQAAIVFVQHHGAILEGDFDEALLDSTRSAAGLEALRTTARELIYPYHAVLEIETAGFRVLAGLLHDFLGAAWEHPRSKRAEKVLSLVSDEYLDNAGATPYEYVMSLVEFVASMTDDFAIQRYRILRGMELPRT